MNLYYPDETQIVELKKKKLYEAYKSSRLNLFYAMNGFKMDHEAFETQRHKLLSLIEKKSSVEEIAEFLDKDAAFKEYLAENESWTGQMTPEWTSRSNPLQFAVVYGNVDIVKMLIEDYGLSVDSRQTYHNNTVTALHRAIHFNKVKSLRELLFYGADTLLGGVCGGYIGPFDSALDLSRICGNKDIEIILTTKKGR